MEVDMAVQNLISATIAAETRAEIMQAIAAIRGKLDFLLSLQGGEVMDLVKAGKEFGPFLDECHTVAAAQGSAASGFRTSPRI